MGLAFPPMADARDEAYLEKSCPRQPHHGLVSADTITKLEDENHVMGVTAASYRQRLIRLSGILLAGCLCSGVPAANIIVNGNFSAGNTGFGSDYFYTSNNTTEAEYYIGTNAADFNGGFYALNGPTGNTDPYYIGNGAADVSLIPWYQTVTGASVTGVTVTTNVQSPTFYRFESLVSNLVDPQTYVSPALYFEINVNNQGWNDFTRTTDTPFQGWGENYVDTYFLTAPTSLAFRLRNFETEYLGNDFALDNIYFGLTTNSPSYTNGETTIFSAGDIANPTYVDPDAVPEIDPAGIGSVLALVTGALGLLERRRLKAS
jgi:hypothetical protein